jgi:ABC-type branched-subunit amino acid transport system substrate-binding protein
MFGKRKMLAAATALMTLAAGCGSSKSSGSSTGSTGGGGGGGGKHTLTIGILTDLTGPAASTAKTSVLGAEAALTMAAQQGYTLKFVDGDSQTAPGATLAAAQKLVEEDHVTAVIAISALAFAAANYLKSQNIPVVGVAEDGPEWITDTNMFSAYGFLDATKVSTTAGLFFKMEGVTDVGAVGYSISPQSSEAAKATAAAAKAEGLKVGYLNAAFPFGSTNVEPIALAMKSAGVDGFTSETDPNTSFALIDALRNVGSAPKVALLPTGYGGDLAQAGPGALQSAQGVYFSLSFEPVEMHTSATEQFQAALKGIGITTDPTYAEYAGYISVALLLDGLKAAGPNPTHASLIAGLSSINAFDGAGLLGSHTLSMSNRAASATGVDSCQYVTRLSGSTFQLVPGADPICGTELPGASVSASS